VRVASKPKATCDATLTALSWRPSDASRINCCRPVQIKSDKPKVNSVAYIRRSYARIRELLPPLHSSTLREQRSREKKEIGAWLKKRRRKEDFKIISNPPWIFELHYDLPILSLFYAFFHHDWVDPCFLGLRCNLQTFSLSWMMFWSNVELVWLLFEYSLFAWLWFLDWFLIVYC